MIRTLAMALFCAIAIPVVTVSMFIGAITDDDPTDVEPYEFTDDDEDHANDLGVTLHPEWVDEDEATANLIGATLDGEWLP